MEFVLQYHKFWDYRGNYSDINNLCIKNPIITTNPLLRPAFSVTLAPGGGSAVVEYMGISFEYAIELFIPYDPDRSG